MKGPSQVKLMLKTSQSIFVIVVSSSFPEREAGPTVTAALLPSLGPSTRGHVDRELLDPSPLQCPSAPFPLLSSLSLCLCRSSPFHSLSLLHALWRSVGKQGLFFSTA